MQLGKHRETPEAKEITQQPIPAVSLSEVFRKYREGKCSEKVTVQKHKSYERLQGIESSRK